MKADHDNAHGGKMRKARRPTADIDERYSLEIFEAASQPKQDLATASFIISVHARQRIGSSTTVRDFFITAIRGGALNLALDL